MFAQSGHDLGAALAKQRCLANDNIDVVAAACLRARRAARAPSALVRFVVNPALKQPFHIAVFGRPLIAGHVKTRLIAAYGIEGATRIYSQLVERTLRAVVEAGASASLWIAGATTHVSVTDWARRYALPAHSQCEGDLGARMAHCLVALAATHERVLLIGTDCPGLTVDHLQGAAAALTGTCHWVFTPAEDGGYVLVGSNAPSGEPFVDIAWSTSEVMAQTRAALRANSVAWAETATLWDVDVAIDAERAHAAGWITDAQKEH